MSKNSTRAAKTKESSGPQTEAQESTVQNDRPATAAAPVASTVASESTVDTDVQDGPVVNTGAEDRAKAIAVGSTTTAKEKAPKKDAFVINVNLRAELHALTNAALLERARDKLKPVDLADSRVFIIDDTKGLVDQIVGSDLSRSGIRSAVIDFLRSRDENQAPGWAIASYMHLASGESGVGVYKGKFDQGYLAARGRDVRRGMVSRGQLKFGDHDVVAPGIEAKTGLVETTSEHVEEPPVDPVIETIDLETEVADTKELPIQEDVGAYESRQTEVEE